MEYPMCVSFLLETVKISWLNQPSNGLRRWDKILQNKMERINQGDERQDG